MSELKIRMWPGQFIGFTAKSRFSDSVVNMLSLKFCQWPERSHSERSRICGALHFLVAVVLVDAAHVLLDLLPDRPALGMPEHHARRLFLRVEEVELLAELAVVALLGFLDAVEVGVEVLLLRPRRAVDALEHLVARIAAPVGAGDLHELEHLELARGRHVRPAAEVDEVAFAIERDGLVARDRGDDLGLVVLAHALEELDRVVARHLRALARARPSSRARPCAARWRPGPRA